MSSLSTFVLHIFLAGMGMFYLARQLKFRDETAFIMGVSYMLSGFFIGNAQHFMWIISGTWIPFIIGAFLALKDSPSLSGAVKLGLAFFMIMTGGYPAFIFLLLYLLTAIYILFTVDHIRKKEFGDLMRFTKYLGIAAVFTILCGMVILISVYHLQDAMTRGLRRNIEAGAFRGIYRKELHFFHPSICFHPQHGILRYRSLDVKCLFWPAALVFFLTGL